MGFQEIKKRSAGGGNKASEDSIRITHRIRKESGQSSIEVHIGAGVLRHLGWKAEGLRLKPLIGDGEDKGILRIELADNGTGYKLGSNRNRTKYSKASRKIAFTPNNEQLVLIGVKPKESNVFEYGDFDVHDGAIIISTIE